MGSPSSGHLNGGNHDSLRHVERSAAKVIKGTVGNVRKEEANVRF
jgi:hypothetical protein